MTILIYEQNDQTKLQALDMLHQVKSSLLFLISCYFLFLTQVCTFLHSETSVKIVLFNLSNRKQTDLGFSTQIESFHTFSRSIYEISKLPNLIR